LSDGDHLRVVVVGQQQRSAHEVVKGEPSRTGLFNNGSTVVHLTFTTSCGDHERLP
jgi:hypothetical protein